MTFIKYLPGATPLDPNEIAGLIPSYITTQGELDTHEQSGILEAQVWATSKNHKDILTEQFAKNLHQRMFKSLWRWAGQFRNSDKSIGVPWPQVAVELKKLMGDADYWIANKIYPMDELAARLHYRLVFIHPFPNGNGRWARLMTDIFLNHHEQPVFSWGAAGSENTADEIGRAGTTREKYIQALQAADQKNFKLLIEFVRS